MDSFLPLRPNGATGTASGPLSLLEAIHELTGTLQLLLTALGGTSAPARPTTCGPVHEAMVVAEATEDWDTPWHSLTVRELRALVRDLPIDRTSLPAPIELMRRSELLEALNQVQSLDW